MKLRTQRKKDDTGTFVSGKAMRRLNARQDDHAAMCASTKHELKVQLRIDSGGYHKPGSMKR